MLNFTFYYHQTYHFVNSSSVVNINMKVMRSMEFTLLLLIYYANLSLHTLTHDVNIVVG